MEYLERNWPNTEVVLELQLAFLDQGYYRKATDCISQVGLVIFRGPEDLPTMMFMLMVLTSKFAGCCALCEWEQALDSAAAIFSMVCDINDGEKEVDSIDHILLRVRHHNAIVPRICFTTLLTYDRSGSN